MDCHPPSDCTVRSSGLGDISRLAQVVTTRKGTTVFCYSILNTSGHQMWRCFPTPTSCLFSVGTSSVSYSPVQFWHLSTWSHCQIPQARGSILQDCPPPPPSALQIPVWVLGCHLRIWLMGLPTAPSSGVIIRYRSSQNSGKQSVY